MPLERTTRICGAVKSLTVAESTCLEAEGHFKSRTTMAGLTKSTASPSTVLSGRKHRGRMGVHRAYEGFMEDDSAFSKCFL